MMRARELVATIATLRADDLETWIRDELVMPDRDADEPSFSAMECARVRLICTLYYELEVDMDTLPMVLSLLDQLYDTRLKLLTLTAALAVQDADTQRGIFATMEARRKLG